MFENWELIIGNSPPLVERRSVRGIWKKLELFFLAIIFVIFFLARAGSVCASNVVVVSGAGSADYNGTYNENGVNGGKPTYRLDASHWLWWKADVSRWMLSPGVGIVPVGYHGNLVPDLPANPWTPILAAAPGPTLSIETAPEPPTPPTPPTPETPPTIGTSGTTTNQDQSGQATNNSATSQTAQTEVEQNAKKIARELKQAGAQLHEVKVINEVGNEISKSFVPVAVFAVTVVATSAAALSALAASISTQVSIKEIILMLSNYFFSLFHRKKRDKFGLVYDQLSKKPIPGAVIRLFEFSTMKLIATAVSDTKGHFFFEVKPGSYVISVVKKHYMFPSKGVSKEEHYLERAYIGQTININQDVSFVNVKIPLDLTSKNRIPHFSLANLLLSSTIRYTLLISGSAISVFVLIISQGTANYIMVWLYLLLWLLELIIQNREVKFNRIYDKNDKMPIDLAVVRILSREGKLVETNISDARGRFVARFNDENNKMSINRVGYQKLEVEPKITGLLEGKKYYLNKT